MVFNARTYSVLIVSASEKFSSAVVGLLPPSEYYPVKIVTSIAAAKRITLEKCYDIVLVNAPLPDDFGTSFAIRVSEQMGTVCLMFVKSDVEAQISGKVHDFGVYTLVKPTSAQAIRDVMGYLSVTRERLRMLETKSLSLEDKMKEIRIVNRAKWLLIEHLKMLEEDAHHYLEKEAMNSGRTRREVAESIIERYQT